MKLVILGCAVTTQVKEYDVEYICIGFDMTTDVPFGGVRNARRKSQWLFLSGERAGALVGKLMFRMRKVLPEEAENEDAITEEMRDLAIEGLAAFFSTHEWWSKNLREAHDIKAGSMVMDVVECEQYINENDIRVITKA